METMILFSKLVGMSLLVSLICLGGFYCGFKIVEALMGDDKIWK